MNTYHSGKQIRGSRLAVLLGTAMFGAVGLAASGTAAAAQPDLHCRLRFSLTAWSAIYEHADGRGRVTCVNGESIPVHIRVHGGGLTAGKWRIEDGRGTFTNVYDIHEVLGGYAQASVSAGAIRAGTAEVLSKGTVSLALAGTGRGINLGVAGAKFTISRAEPARAAEHRK